MDTQEFLEVRDQVRKHEQSLYGENGDNGIRGTVRDHEHRLTSMEKRVYILCALFAAGGASAPEVVKQFLS